VSLTIFPILLQVEKEDNKPPISFKFNSKWLEDEVGNLVKIEWIGYDDSLRVFQFATINESQKS
jgi:hypothetical protein